MIKRTLIILFILLSLLITASFANNKLKIGVYNDPPLTYVNEKGEAEGFVVDIFEYIATSQRIDIEYIYGTWTEMTNALESNEIDVLLDIVKDDSRATKYTFNDEPIYLSWGVVVQREDEKIETILDLDKKTVGYLENDYYAVTENGVIDLSKEFHLDTQYIKYNEYEAIFNDIDSGRLDAGIINKINTRKIYDYGDISLSNIIVAPGGVRIASNKHKNIEFLELFDRELKQLKQDKTSYFYERYDYWFANSKENTFLKFYHDNQRYLFMFLAIITGIIIVSRVQVYIKSKELKVANKSLIKKNKMINNYNDNLQEINMELEGAYQDIEFLVKKYEMLLTFLSSNMGAMYSDIDLFLKRFLQIAMHLIDESDYGVIYKYDEQDQFIIVDTYNHPMVQIDSLKREDLKPFSKKIRIIDSFYNEVSEKLKNEDKLQEIEEKWRFSKQTLILTFSNSRQVVGGLLLEIEKDSEKKFRETSKKVMKAFKNICDIYFTNRQLFKNQNKFQKEIILSVVEMLEIHDEYTKGHSESVANLSKKLAIYLDIEMEKADEIYWAGLVHDIGKILIPKEIINKKGTLTVEEYEKIKKHPMYGFRALNNSETTKNIANYTLYHHERIDGKGYTKGLKGNRIPLQSKIINIVDAYDAMTSERPYRKPLTKKEAITEIKNNLGTQFDQEIGEKFIEMLENQCINDQQNKIG